MYLKYFIHISMVSSPLNYEGTFWFPKNILRVAVFLFKGGDSRMGELAKVGCEWEIQL